MDRTVIWPLLPDELTIAMLFTLREEKKCKNAMSFRQGHARGAYSSNCCLKRSSFVNRVQRRLLDMNRDGF